jgi:hypothetical protein
VADEASANRVGRLLDLAQPAALLLVAVLHFITDAEDPWPIGARFWGGLVGVAHKPG